jgi:hypothetical protein
VSPGQAGNRFRAAKAQDDDIDVSVARKLLDCVRRASHDGAQLDLLRARTMSQPDDAQMKAAGDGANSSALLAGQMAAQDEHVEPMLLRASKEGPADKGG